MEKERRGRSEVHGIRYSPFMNLIAPCTQKIPQRRSWYNMAAGRKANTKRRRAESGRETVARAQPPRQGAKVTKSKSPRDNRVGEFMCLLCPFAPAAQTDQQHYRDDYKRRKT